MAICLWGTKIVSDMQWPCPDGFHVPLNTEWQAVYDIRTALGGGGSDWTNFWKTLKLPFSGFRDRTNASIDDQGYAGRYWSSSRRNYDNAYYLYFRSNSIWPQYTQASAFGMSIRPFKDTPTTPTSSWTKLYWTSIESWWIFWSSTDWLVSLSSNWTTWITIADKNLWATTVWNSWDTLSEANCGWYFQRWNNYMFPFTWSVTTSSTKVDASNYWPWNYYSSSTFITKDWSWDYPYNYNLRWWVSQWTTEVKTEPKKIYLWNNELKAVYLWDTKVRPPFNPRTFTISRTEKSDMSSWWTYSDDAAWLTAWDTAFDEFFWYSAVLLDASWNEVEEVKQSSPWVLNMGSFSWALTWTANNVMIKFPVRWIKMTKSWSKVTLSITKELEKYGYQYYAFTKWATIDDYLYIWAYEWTFSNDNSSVASSFTDWTTYLKSWATNSRTANFSPAANQSRPNFRSSASKNWSWYSILTWYPAQYIAALYMMKYWNPNCQSVVWKWYSWWSSSIAPWWTNSQTNATYWTSSNTTQAKLFWLEDFWGNVGERVDGCWYNSSSQLTVDKTNSIFQDSDYIMNLWSSATWYIAAIWWDNDKMFIGISSGGSATTYYTDSAHPWTSVAVTRWGSYRYWDNNWLFFIENRSATSPAAVFGGRLMYLQPWQAILKSFDEIIEMSNDKAELNTYPTEYYAKFSSENHLYNYNSLYYLTPDGTYGNMYLIKPKYNPSTSLRQ